MGFISTSIFEDILSFIVLENRFPDIEQLSNHAQNEALFGILNREDVFAIWRLAMESKSYSSAFQIFAENNFKRVFLSKEWHCGTTSFPGPLG